MARGLVVAEFAKNFGEAFSPIKPKLLASSATRFNRSGIRQEFRNGIVAWKTETLGEFRYETFTQP